MMMAPSEAAAIAVGGGVGINIGSGSGGEGVWVGGGIINSNPTPAGPSASKLNSVYMALQAWKAAITDDPLGVLKSWNGLDLSSYKGVFCSDSSYGNGPSVIAIDLNHANLQGSLVKELSVLTDMSVNLPPQQQ
ncbi:hypothetical protein V6N12_026063 [Hibiscus sabdariffa]|uniref:Leucine-rich repeat-containing N-terminal plant-type domain-containing protein n=1 Tax=Hibiscus sabdariffa TaxID=183260 RepID=A0ABR2DR67_9ROSI